jgi:hypothetical protein
LGLCRLGRLDRFCRLDRLNRNRLGGDRLNYSSLSDGRLNFGRLSDDSIDRLRLRRCFLDLYRLHDSGRLWSRLGLYGPGLSRLGFRGPGRLGFRGPGRLGFRGPGRLLIDDFLGLDLTLQTLAIGLSPDTIRLSLHHSRRVALHPDAQGDTEVKHLRVGHPHFSRQLVDADVLRHGGYDVLSAARLLLVEICSFTGRSPVRQGSTAVQF